MSNEEKRILDGRSKYSTISRQKSYRSRVRWMQCSQLTRALLGKLRELDQLAIIALINSSKNILTVGRYTPVDY